MPRNGVSMSMKLTPDKYFHWNKYDLGYSESSMSEFTYTHFIVYLGHIKTDLKNNN